MLSYQILAVLHKIIPYNPVQMYMYNYKFSAHYISAYYWFCKKIIRHPFNVFKKFKIKVDILMKVNARIYHNHK